jgi:D-alanine transaminase
VIAERPQGRAERPFTVAEAKAAREAFITGAGGLVLPVVRVDGKEVGDGKPGPVATRLRRLYIEREGASRNKRARRVSGVIQPAD